MPAIKRNTHLLNIIHYLSRRMGIILLAAVMLFTGGCKKVNTNNNGETVQQYTLSVTLNEGVDGTPATGTYLHNQGDSVHYAYQVESGYWGLETKQDGTIVPAEGDITINQDINLQVTAKSLDELLNQVKYWAYQIQDVSNKGAVDALATSHYDMLVLEPTRTDWSSGDETFDTKGMVQRLKNTQTSDGERRKLVIAYINIGQAEDWRWYWTWSKNWEEGEPRPADWPNYILTHDPDGWEGDYPVAYWDSRWKDIVIYGKNQDSKPYGDYNSMIDEVIKDGFDGIYLDWVEAFENEEVIRAAEKKNKDPVQEMVTFIQEMREYAEKRVPNFIIIQQNASALCEDHHEIFTIVDAIAQEEVWYAGDATDNWNDPDGYDQPVPNSWTKDYIYYLEKFLTAGLPVFNCEYAVDFAADGYSRSYKKHYIPYCTRRSLSRLTTTPPPGY